MVFSEADFASTLQGISSRAPQQRTQEYLNALNSLLTQPRSSVSAQQLLSSASQFLQVAVFSDLNSSGGGLIVGRSTLSALNECVKQVVTDGQNGSLQAQEQPIILDEEVRLQLYQDTLAKIQPRMLSFEEQASTICLSLADVHESLQDWQGAAQTLQEIPLDSGHRTVSNHVKLRIYMRIVRLLLEADDPVSADAYLKRASMVVHTVPGTGAGGSHQIGTSADDSSNTNPASSAGTQGGGLTASDVKEGKVLGLQYKLSQAKIYDAQRRFTEAAMRYHELSYITDIDEEDRHMMLSAAVTASILAPAGPQRSRVLSTLIRDERASSLPQFTILSKVFLDEIVGTEEITTFESMLQPHQKAQLPTSNDVDASTSSQLKSSPRTVLERAMMEHNIVACSKLYINITFEGLGLLLSLTPTGTETMIRRMISQKRLLAQLNQVEGLITFLSNPNQQQPIAGGLGISNEEDTNNAESTVREEVRMGETLISHGKGDGLIKRWDEQIAKTASALEEVCVRIHAQREGKFVR
ncbi:unnamed protein product [Sympodiomycopsis kandeliae]